MALRQGNVLLHSVDLPSMIFLLLLIATREICRFTQDVIQLYQKRKLELCGRLFPRSPGHFRANFLQREKGFLDEREVLFPLPTIEEGGKMNTAVTQVARPRRYYRFEYLASWLQDHWFYRSPGLLIVRLHRGLRPVEKSSSRKKFII